MTAISGLPFIPSKVVIVWRVGEAEANHGLDAGDFDWIIRCDAGLESN